MEYCEGKLIFHLSDLIMLLVGDLAYHIKRALQNNKTFTEQEIFHWFIQICMAL